VGLKLAWAQRLKCLQSHVRQFKNDCQKYTGIEVAQSVWCLTRLDDRDPILGRGNGFFL